MREKMGKKNKKNALIRNENNGSAFVANSMENKIATTTTKLRRQKKWNEYREVV